MAEGQEKCKKETERNGHSLFKHLFGDLESGWATLWMKREDNGKETVWFPIVLGRRTDESSVPTTGETGDGRLRQPPLRRTDGFILNAFRVLSILCPRIPVGECAFHGFPMRFPVSIDRIRARCSRFAPPWFVGNDSQSFRRPCLGFWSYSGVLPGARNA